MSIFFQHSQKYGLASKETEKEGTPVCLSARRRVKWHLFGFDDYHFERRTRGTRGESRRGACVRALFRLLRRRRRRGPAPPPARAAGGERGERFASRVIHRMVCVSRFALARLPLNRNARRAAGKRAFAEHVRQKSFSTTIVSSSINDESGA